MRQLLTEISSEVINLLQCPAGKIHTTCEEDEDWVDVANFILNYCISMHMSKNFRLYYTPFGIILLNNIDGLTAVYMHEFTASKI